MSNNPMMDILGQKAQSVSKAVNTKQAKFTPGDLSLSLNQFRQQFPDADALTERAWMNQKNQANPVGQNNSFFQDAGTDLSIAFGDRLPQTGGAILGVLGDAIGSESLADTGWDYVAQQQAETAESARFYSPELKQSNERIRQAGEARKAELMQDGEMSTGDSLQEFFGTVGDYIQNPRSAASEAIQSSESLLTMAATGGAAGAIAKGVLRKKLSQKALEQAALKASGATATAYTGLSEGANNAIQTRDALNSIPDGVLYTSPDFQQYLKESGGDFDTAKDEFVKSGTADTFLLSGAAAALIGKASGAADTFGQALVKQGTSGTLKSSAKAAATEAVEEVAQSGSGQLIGNVQEQEGDTSKDILEDVGSSAAAGAVSGGLSGGATKAAIDVPKAAVASGAKATAKAAAKVSEQVETKKAEAEAQKATPTNKAYSEAKTKADPTERFIKMSDEEIVGSKDEVVSTLLALREKQNSPDTSPEEATQINNRIEAVKAKLKTASNKVIEKAQAEPENLTPKEANQAMVAVVADGEVNTELAGKLSGSKHLTTNQKTLLTQLQDSASKVSKVLKSRQEVNRDIIEGGEGFTGLKQYIDVIQTAVNNDAQESALLSLRRLGDFNKSQARKLKAGIKNPELKALVKDESEAIGIVFNALKDTVDKAFPEVAAVRQKSTKEQVSDALGKVKPRANLEGTHTVPQAQREQLVREATTSILDVAKSPEGVGKVRFNLRKAGVTADTIKGITEALKVIDGNGSGVELRQAKDTVSEAYLTMRDALGSEGFTEALSTFGDKESVDKILNTLPQESELNTEEVEKSLAHVAEPKRTKELASEADFAKYESLRATVKEYVEADPSVLDEVEGASQAYIDVQVANLNEFSTGTLEAYNGTVELLNGLEVPNQEVTTANSETKAVSTTPRNRVFQNTIESLPAGSFLRQFISTGSRNGLMHTENNLIAKLADKGDYYTHLTRNLSYGDLSDLNQYVRYAQKFVKKLDKTLVGREEAKANNDKFATTPTNDHLDDFIENGSFKPEVATALGTAMSNWAVSNARKSLFNTNESIAKLLGETPDGFRPNKEERKLQDAGIALSYVAQQIGKDAMLSMHLMPKGTADENAAKQLQINLGMSAVAAGLTDGNSILTRQYAHIVRDDKGTVVQVEINDKTTKLKIKEGQTQQQVPVVKATPNKVQVEGESVRLNSALEDAIVGGSNDAIMRDFLGAVPSFNKVYMEGEQIREHTVEDGLAQVQADALNKNQEIPYQLDEGMWSLMNQLDPEYKLALVDGLPPEGTEHVNNRERNRAIREDIAKEFEDVATMVQQMQDAESATVRFAMQASKKNKRMNQQGTLGNPQNSKLVRHLFKMVNNSLTVNPTDTDLMLSYQMAVLEALDEDTADGKGVDKSTDAGVAQGFEEFLAKPKTQAAIKAMQAETKTRSDIEAIQDFIGLPQVKRGAGTSGTASRLDGLVALAQYKPNEPFEVNLFKENDGITNGIGIALFQLAGASSYDDYVNRLARVGVYIDTDMKSFGSFAKAGFKDSYVTFGDLMTQLLQNPESSPASDFNILPELNLNRNISDAFFGKGLRDQARGMYIPVTDVEGTTRQQKRLEKSNLKITREEYNQTSGSMAYFLGKGFREKDGSLKTVKDYVEEVIRDFAKNPLMIANYGASMIGLKKSVANNIVGTVELALEELNQLEGEAFNAFADSIEQAVNGMSPIPLYTPVFEDGQKVGDNLWTFKIDRENPLETVVDQYVYQSAAIGVEYTYGPAMEKAFDVEYGQQRKDVDQIIQASRIATEVYRQVLDKTRKAKMEELGRSYLTVDEAAAIIEELKPNAPYIATAMSDDRLNDGIYIPKGEGTKDREDGKYLSESTDKVKLAIKMGDNSSVESHTYSNKVKDPSVSAAAVLTQSLDATAQTLSMMETDLVNVHDASIFSLADSFEGTRKQNQGFSEALTSYSMFDATREMLDSVMSHELVDDAMKADVAAMMESSLKTHIGEEGTLEDFLGYMSDNAKRINHNRGLLNSAPMAVNQYSAGDNSAYITEPSNPISREARDASWIAVGTTPVTAPTFEPVEVVPTEVTPVDAVQEAIDKYQPRKKANQALKEALQKFLVQRDLNSSLDSVEASLQNDPELNTYAGDFKAFKKAIQGKVTEAGKVLAGSSGNARSKRAQDAAAELEIDKSSFRPIFEGLADKGAVRDSREHSIHLNQMVSLLEPTIDSLRLAIFKENAEASGAVTDSGIELTINTGAKASGIEMSTQETLVHEVMHTLIQGADKKSRAYREIRKMYAQARKELKPEDFLGDITNPTEQDLKDAKARYDHTVHNAIQGGGTYKTYLGEEKPWFNADPAEEFAVMALTNANLREALAKKELRLKQDTNGIINKMKALMEWLMDKFGKDLTMNGVNADKRIVRLAEHLQGSLNQKKGLLYRAQAVIDVPLDAASSWIHNLIGKHTAQFEQAYDLLKDTPTGISAREKAKEYKQAALNTAFAKNSLTVSLYNEFTSGRRSLDDLARLIAKSSALVERNPQFFTETISRELGEVFKGVTEPERAVLYRMLESDAQHLLGKHSMADIVAYATDSRKRKVRIAQLVKELRKVAPSAASYMATHAKDLGYHMVTGERLLVDGKYTNAMQIANMWGYTGSKGKIAPKQAEVLIDELATMNALEYADQDTEVSNLMAKYNNDALETMLTYHQEVVDAALGTTFLDNEYNYRKGYVKEEYANQVDITVAGLEEDARLTALGYERGEPVKGDPLVKGKKQFFYIKENNTPARYLTGALSTASPSKRGTDPFMMSTSDSELTKLQVTLDQQALMKAKQLEAKRVFNGSATFVKGPDRGNVAQPVFDSQGNVTSYRYVASHKTKNEIHGRKMDFARGLGSTYGGITRRIGAKTVNEELMDYFHQQFTNDYAKNPGQFVNIAKDSNYREQYNLMPPETKRYAQSLFGSRDIWVPRTQVELAIGYRKFSVGQLQWDKDPKATAAREVLRHTNNLASVMFNNRVGVTLETYWQAFVNTAKDTLVIKSGVVTAANIASNLTLLWFSGVSPVQASKDHAEAYKYTWQYLQDKEAEFRTTLDLKRPNLSVNERKKLESKRAVLRQDLLNNPVRELMEAGMYSAIVDDVEVGEHVAVTKDWLDKKLEPLTERTPEAVKAVAKNFMLTHDTKAYKVMRDVAQISDFAARYSLHKHNLANGMKKEDSYNDIRTTFVDYDMPSHKAIQYANDMGLLGFTKYFFRIQQVILKRFAERPARVMGFALLNSMAGLGVASPTDAAFGFNAMNHRMYGVDDWFGFATQTAPMNLLVN